MIVPFLATKLPALSPWTASCEQIAANPSETGVPFRLVTSCNEKMRA